MLTTQERRLASVYIGVVGNTEEPGVGRDSIENIRRRDGDAKPKYIRATKGYEARQAHLELFLKSDYDACLLLDHDMVFPPDTLERLRGHGEAFVSGYYMRRMFRPIAPVWYEPYSGEWPMMPWLGEPERGKLHELGASGWGCVLLHREVLEAVKPLLKGEWFVIEDDMDVYPYNLVNVLAAVNTFKEELAREHVRTSKMKMAAQVIVNEIKPLRAMHDVVGSDLRFPFFALQAGYQLLGDPDVRPGHIVGYPVSPDDYTAHGQEQLEAIKSTQERVAESRKDWRKQMKTLAGLGLERDDD